MALLQSYDINALATQISTEFYIHDNDPKDRSQILIYEMRLFALEMKSRVTFISRSKK